MSSLPPRDSALLAVIPFAAKWIVSNLMLEVILGSWILLAYLFAVRTLLDYFVLKQNSFTETLAICVRVFIRKVIPASLIVIPLVLFSQVAVFLGLFILFMLLMAPVLLLVRSENGFRIILSSVFLNYVKELKLAKLEVMILLMSLGGLLMFTFYGMEYFLAYLKHLDVYYALPSFLINPIAALSGINFLTVLIEIFEVVGISLLLITAAGATVSAYAKMEQESLRKELT